MRRFLLFAVLFGLAAYPIFAEQSRNGAALGLPANSAASMLEPEVALVDLGRRMFLDKRLSADGQMSCSSCHVPSHGFTKNSKPEDPASGTPLRLRRNPPTLFNVAYAEPLHHDGREPSLEQQVLAPLFAPEEMANPSIPEFVSRINAFSDYQLLFKAAFNKSTVSMEDVARALAAFERSLLSANSPFDRWWYGGDERYVRNEVRDGFMLFTGKAGCAECHTVGSTSAIFSDNQFHNTGIGYVAEEQRKASDVAGIMDRGREEVTHESADRFKFRTPSLRNVELTAPYMHDGSLATLDEVVAHYNRGGGPYPNKDPRMKPIDLTDKERADLVVFLKSLTGSNAHSLMAMEP